jgi:hypothetical protein
MTFKRQLYRWTDSETWRGNVVLVALFALALLSWFGCVPDRSGLLGGVDTDDDATADGQPLGPAPDAAPSASDTAPQLAPDTAPTAPPPDTAPPAPDVGRVCDDTTNPCSVCQACKRGVCIPADEHELCGPQTCAPEDSKGVSHATVARVCHGGACAPLAVVKDCDGEAVCKFDDSGRPYVVPGVCARLQGGGFGCTQNGAAFRYCDRTCGQGDGGVWQCR